MNVTDELVELFSFSFLAEEMEMDISSRLKEMLLNISADKLKEYSAFDYDASDNHGYKLDWYFFNKVSSVLIKAAFDGDLYARNVIVALYKRHYKKEYNVVKRFTFLSDADIKRITNNENMPFDLDYLRIAIIADMRDIKLDDIVIRRINSMSVLKQKCNDEIKVKSPMTVQSYDLTNCIEWVKEHQREIIAASNNENMKSVRKVVKSLLDMKSCNPDFLDDCFDCKNEIYLKTWVKVAYFYDVENLSISDLAIVHLIFVLVDKVVESYSQIENIFGDLFSGEYELYTKIEESCQEIQEDDVQIEEISIETLRNLRKKNRDLIDIINELKEENKRLRRENRRYEKINYEEIIDTIVSVDEEHDNEVSTEKIERIISQKKIVIIGGDDFWYNKLKNQFPEWRFIRPDSDQTQSLSILDNADAIYFYTKYMGHDTYKRAKNYMEKNSLKYGYIETYNIEQTLKRIYEDFRECIVSKN